jgi:hypothetical protein
VEEGVNGFTSEVGDAGSLVHFVTKIASDPELGKSLKSAARRSVEEYSWAKRLTPFGALMDELICRPLRREAMPSLDWIEDMEATERVCYAAECVATAVADIRKRQVSPVLGLRILRSMLEGSRLSDCTRALGLLRGVGYGAADASSGSH